MICWFEFSFISDCFIFFAQHSFVSSVLDNKPLRELIAEAKAEVTEEIEEHKEEEEEEESEAHLVRKHLRKFVYSSNLIKRKLSLQQSMAYRLHLQQMTCDMQVYGWREESVN